MIRLLIIWHFRCFWKSRCWHVGMFRLSRFWYFGIAWFVIIWYFLTCMMLIYLSHSDIIDFAIWHFPFFDILTFCNVSSCAILTCWCFLNFGVLRCWSFVEFAFGEFGLLTCLTLRVVVFLMLKIGWLGFFLIFYILISLALCDVDIFRCTSTMLIFLISGTTFCTPLWICYCVSPLKSESRFIWW